MWLEQITLRLILIVCLAFLIWLEREFKNQPAWLRTHILIWLWSTLLMIVWIIMSDSYWSLQSDPTRIAAQVVSWIWFIWAWVIMKMWFNTKWLTTAANIWVTAAIWLSVWAWLYFIAIFSTLLILFNLTVITSIKKRFIKQSRYCNIKIDIKKNKLSLKHIISTIDKLPVEILSKNTKEDKKRIIINVVCKINNKINTYDLHKKLIKNNKLETLSISEK